MLVPEVFVGAFVALNNPLAAPSAPLGMLNLTLPLASMLVLTIRR